MRRPVEISVAAAVAFVGSGLVLLFGLSVAALFGLTVHSVHEKFPGQNLDSIANPIIPGLQRMIVGTMYVCVFLGIAGMVTAYGLLRMRRWARLSTVAWCVASTCVCFLALAYLWSQFGSPIHPRAILTLMLFLFPINAWWLMLFFRLEIRADFDAANAPERNEFERNERWKELAKPRYPEGPLR